MNNRVTETSGCLQHMNIPRIADRSADFRLCLSMARSAICFSRSSLAFCSFIAVMSAASVTNNKIRELLHSITLDHRKTTTASNLTMYDLSITLAASGASFRAESANSLTFIRVNFCRSTSVQDKPSAGELTYFGCNHSCHDILCLLMCLCALQS